jgi:DNA-binding response OmpR family regulator
MSIQDLAINHEPSLEYARAPGAHEGPRASPLELGALVIDRRAHEVRLDGQPVKLTAREFALLAFLSERRGQVLSREQLLEQVWGDRYHGGRRTVDVHVRRLRAKLHAHFPLETLRGVGYKFRSDSPPLAAR